MRNWVPNNRTSLPLLGAVAVFALDQLSKTLVVMSLALHDAVALTPFFNLVYWQNTGAAFGFLSQASGWQKPLFLVIGLAASLLLYRLILAPNSRAMDRWAYALILGGALGNVLDRVLRGAVVDWIDVRWNTWHWPAFNLADSAITVGAVVLVISTFRRVSPVTGTDPSA